MELKYQFNKVSMQTLQKQLNVRVAALPVLKSKESVLRITEKRLKEDYAELEESYSEKQDMLRGDFRLWNEFPKEVYSLRRVVLKQKKIAGIAVPDIDDVEWQVQDFSRFVNHKWLTTGVSILRDMTHALAEMEVLARTIEIIEYARRKTTQKVNLYEKVQIPAYSDAIMKIKRFLEDEANLDKAVQKITKQRNETQALEIGA
ncbi:MAG TPA: V-type ATP synthase subunit D [Spirochaetia bacterium]|nr:V-type ATP synthase subunit D [Spirochaetia bacterium]